MKNVLKPFTFTFIVIIIMASCSYSGGGGVSHPMDDYPHNHDELQKLHIRPTKPIRIPDTIRIVAADQNLYTDSCDSSNDTIPELPQDTIAY